MLRNFYDMMNRGGPVMWVLLAVNFLSWTILFERFWFWLRTNSRARLDRLARMTRLLREGELAKAQVLAEDDDSVYGHVVCKLLEGKPSDAAAMEAVELQRPALERFMPFLTTIITGAPMIGLIGTVIGLIGAFNTLSTQTGNTDPRTVGHSLAQALLNTVAGLVVAVIVLFPYNYFRGQIDRTLGRFESLIAAVQHAAERGSPVLPVAHDGADLEGHAARDAVRSVRS
jgi:biopolymer transport protein ExbB/TolQ